MDEYVLWALPDGSITDDPCAGEEFEKPKYVGSCACANEIVEVINRHYEGGADGIVKINKFYGDLFFRDCGHSEAVRRHVEEETLFGVTKGQYIFFTER